MKVQWAGAVFAAFVVMSAPASVAANVSNDQVLSQHIKDADGTSGQNTSVGSGVKTGHIQDGAVTNAKIAPGAVGASELSPGAVGASQLAPGSVTNSAIAGPISRSKIERYGAVAIVAKSGGDYSDPLTAMANRAVWCPTPTATTPCLLQLLPGVYDVGATPLRAVDFIDIAGSGEGVTRIVGTVAGPNESAAVITGWAGGAGESGQCEVRDLTVENAGSGQENIAILNVARIRRVTVISTTGANVNRGIEARSSFASTIEDSKVFVGNAWVNMAICAAGGNLTIRNTRALANGIPGGSTTSALLLSNGIHQVSNVELRAYLPEVQAQAILMFGGELYGRNVVAIGEGPDARGVFMNSAKAVFDASQIGGTGASIEVGWNYAGEAYIANSRLDGGAAIASPSSKLMCAGVTDENFAFYANVCP